MKTLLVAFAAVLIGATSAQAQYLGNYTANPYLPPAPPQPPGTYNNPYGSTGNSPQMYNFTRAVSGKSNSNRYDPNSVANPYGRYGSQYSPDSINNPYGAGSPYRQDSPNNPYGTGMRTYR